MSTMNERVGAIFDGMRIQSSPITKLKLMLRSDPNLPKHGGHHHHNSNFSSDEDEDDDDCSFTTHRSSTTSNPNSNYYSSSADASPRTKSSWVPEESPPNFVDDDPKKIFGLIGSIVREEGHIYSIAVSGDLLYTGCDSKTVGVWRNLKEQSGFKSHSGLVKAIVLSGDRVFTGHQDGKIRVWRASQNHHQLPGGGGGLVIHHKRVGSMPAFKDLMKTSIMKPATNIIVHHGHTRKHSKYGGSSIWMIKHADAVSCLSLNEDLGLLYSGSWDRTIKVWRISDSECLESVDAHDDYVNAIACGLGGLVFTGSADGSVKAWRRDLQGLSTKHSMLQVLLKQESAVTSLAVERGSGWVYSGSSDGLVNFWEGVKNLAHGGTLKGHKMAVLCLAAGGSLVFSGSADKSICVWRRDESGAHVLSSILTGHTGPIKCLAVQEDHEYDDEEMEMEKNQNQSWKVYSGSLDQSVKVWRVCHNQPGREG